MSTSVITTGVNHLRHVLNAAVAWGTHGPATATGPADLDLPFVLAAALPPLTGPRAAEVPPSSRVHRPGARHRPRTVRR
jgi:hypothetical protein